MANLDQIANYIADLVDGITIKAGSQTAVSVATATWVNTSEVTLTPGLWIVSFGGMFSSNSSGRRVLTFGTSSGTNAYSLVQTAVNGADMSMGRTRFIQVTTSATYRLYVSQNSGSTLTFTPRLDAIKLRP